MNEQLRKRLLWRLKIIEGQVRGVQRMIEADAYCMDIITQLSAAERALSGVEDALLENHLRTCLIDQVKSGQEEKAVREVMIAYKKSKK
ncbi:MAG TPA: metal-sensitive transcriptional regulator [Candidatus Moranbacteria bacterium]|nr:metal-sensitive transcriptional regulator [Candidatus Moranbacteria bacterium]